MDILPLIVLFLLLFLAWLLVHLEEKKIWTIQNLKLKCIVYGIIFLGIAAFGIYDIVEIARYLL